MALDVADAKRLLAGFAGSVYHPILMTALQTGLRLSELLALQWRDLNPVAMTLKVERAIEVTREFGKILKEPKNRRSQRTIVIDPSLVAMLQTERERHLRLRAGVPDGTKVSLRAIKLPANALIFPAPPADGVFDFTKLRNGKTVTRECRERFRKLGFPKLRFHDLRATHGTTLLDAGVPVHTVASRLGHSPEVLLRLYAKRTRKADTSTSGVLADFAKELL
jgi:integrase